MTPQRHKRQSQCLQCGGPNPPKRVRFCSDPCARRHHNTLRGSRPPPCNACRCGAPKYRSSKQCRHCCNQALRRSYQPQSPLWVRKDVQDFVLEQVSEGVARWRIAEKLGEEFGIDATKNMVIGFVDRRSVRRRRKPVAVSTTESRLQALLSLFPDPL